MRYSRRADDGLAGFSASNVVKQPGMFYYFFEGASLVRSFIK